MKKSVSFFLLSLIFTALPLHSQQSLKSIEEEYYDFLALQGLTERPSLNYRTLSDSQWHFIDEQSSSSVSSPFHVWKNNNLGTSKLLYKSVKTEPHFFTDGFDSAIALKIYGPEWFNSYNSKVPYGQNDGALWQGKGFNTSFSAGVRLEAFGIEATFKPLLSWSENKDFKYLPGVYGDKHSYFWRGNIDLVQRFGESSFWNFDWGDSEIRFTWHTFTLGFGTQSPWLGPAWLNPMLGSNNAPTYPKIDAGLRKTKLEFMGIDLGYIEGRVWLGKLTESDYFDLDDGNNERMSTNFAVAYSPSLFEGLTLSINKCCLTNWKDKNFKYLNPFYDQNNIEDQKMSIGADYFFPIVNFDVYGEIGIDDYNTRGFSNPFHTAIYTVGLKKIINPLKQYSIYNEVLFEWNNFEMSQDFQLQWKYMGYYSHSLIKQGFTNRGQIIGAGSGYFGTNLFLGVRSYFPKGSITIFIDYERPDTNYINNKAITSSNSDWDLQSDDWANYRASRTYGINAAIYLTDSLIISGTLSNSWFIKYMYSNDSVNFRNNHAELYLKYIF